METISDFRRMTKMTECVFGLVGDGFVIVAADAATGLGCVSPNTTADKITVLDSHKLIAAIGYPGDRYPFMDSIKEKLAQSQGDGIPWTTLATARFIRGELDAALRKGEVERVSMLVAGYDEGTGPSFYHIDCTASLKTAKKGVFDGDGRYYGLRMLVDRYKSGMSLEEAIRLVDDCMAELKSRRIVKSENYGVKIIDKDGVRVHKPVDDSAILRVRRNDFSSLR
ncbi:proteasome subunit beta type-2-B-like [Neltuma alba]|uniref:proteasome subunit beta type-2-B-like n=1 Tax=Neltuma alba TaxID=207710 RepID=UPI0010A4A167|nr:proteasome subunit beta type-2-B-like [Prosopis alba]